MSNQSPSESSPSSDLELKADAQPTAAWIRFVGVTSAGIAAAIASYFVLSSIGIVYPTPPELMNLGATPTAEERAIATAAKVRADSGNGMIWLGTAGAILGGLVVLLSGLLSGSGRRTPIATIAAVILAGGLGCLAGHWIVGFHQRINLGLQGDRSAAESQFMMMHAAGWAAVGLGMGIGYGLLAPTSKLRIGGRSAMIGGIVGAVAGAAYPILVGVAAPLVDSSRPIPEPGTALVVWLSIPAVLIAAAFSRNSCTE
ncbi:MAG: hypothetical protein ABJZ55_12305 [Fuerstiella sp.]